MPQEVRVNEMSSNKYLKIASYIGLAFSIIPALMVFLGALSKDSYLNLMLVGMVLWFSTAILWIKPDHTN